MAADNKTKLPQLSSNLPELFNRRNWSLLWQTYILVRNWPEIVGKNIAKKSQPAYIQNDTLWVYVQSSVLMQHMQPQKPGLLEKIREMVPEAGIKDIRWAMQPATPDRETEETAPHTHAGPGPEEKKAFDEISSTVEDRKCREALRKLWRAYHNR
ncbi:MAG TPA: DUF721 domain-containing protein [Desulfobacteraceae bacterium]|nr:DUF721 domain-containing protein [Desulfobacteraceae bacterium]